MSPLTRFGAFSALAVAVFLVAGCGTDLDASSTEDLVKANVEKTQQTKVDSVDCPSGIAVEPKTKFSCTVHLADGGTETATLMIRNKDADLSFLGLHPNK